MQETANGFRAQIPPKRRPSAIVFSIIFAAFAVMIGVVFEAHIDRDEKAMFGLAAAVVLSMIGVLGLVSEIFGTETIELVGSSLRVNDRVFGFSRSRQFDITLMQYVRVGASSYWQRGTYVMSEGRIQFDYEGKMISIGGNVDEDDAFRIVDAIHRQLTPGKIGR